MIKFISQAIRWNLHRKEEDWSHCFRNSGTHVHNVYSLKHVHSNVWQGEALISFSIYGICFKTNFIRWYLWMAWHLWDQVIHRHCEEQIHMHETETIKFIRVHVASETLSKQYPVGWSALCLWMAWQPRDQNIHRYNEYQIHMHTTRTTMFIRVHGDTETLKKIQFSNQLCVFGWLGTYGANKSTGTVRITFICKKQQLQCLLRVHVGTDTLTKQYSVRWSVLSVSGLALIGASTSTSTVKIKFICVEQELQCLSEYMMILRPCQNIIHLGNQAQWGSNSYASGRKYNVYQSTCGYWDLDKKLWDHHIACGWLDTYEANTFTGSVRIKFICMK